MLTATKLRVGLIFLVLAFGLSLGIPVEDIPETTYDESEALPYESTLLLSTVRAPARTDQSALTFSHHKPCGACPFLHARVVTPLPIAYSLAQLCALLC